MKLESGKMLQHYEIRNLLGKGGMGEVYLAEDTKLGRPVAIKILNQNDDYEKLRRFRQEAKAISALNHPNILTIHEFDRTEDFYFIVSEYVKGETLRDLLKQRKLSIDESLEIAIQIGNAIAAAHELKIIHRDIKPENIMILPDGYVKVLDFGLAKLQRPEIPFENLADAPTASVIHTQAGLIMGTVNYMSPEQLRGQEVDERTDIWALGAVLFEMLAGRKPFSGESVGDIIANVLHQALPALENIPVEVEAVVTKALAKKKSERFATAREFVKELKTLKLQLLTNGLSDQQLRPLYNSQSLSDNKNVSVAFKNLSEIISTKPKSSLVLLLVILGSIFSAGALTIYFWQKGSSRVPIAAAKFAQLTTTGNVRNAAISPDGRFIAYVEDENGSQSLFLRQSEESAGKELFRPERGVFGNLIFSPDGDSIFFTLFAGSSSGTLYRIPILGSSQQEIARDIDSAIAFSPDGNSFAFLRSQPHEGVDRLLISDLDGTNQRILTEKKKPLYFIKAARESLAWSPDGKSIVVPFGKIDEGEFMSLIEIDAASGQEKILTERKWSRVGRVVWTKDQNILFITAADFGTDLYQIFEINRRDGRIRNISNQLVDFYNISLDKNSSRLLATTIQKRSVISTAETERIDQPRAIASGAFDGVGGMAYTSDGRIVFVSLESGNLDIWVMNEDGSNRRQLTFDKGSDDSPVVAQDNRTIVFVSNRNGTPHLWKMNFEGGELKQLTDKGGESFPQITPDGNFVIFSIRTAGRPTLWKVSLDGGEPVQITNEQTHWSSISPDGKMIACLSRGNEENARMKLAILSAENGEFLKTFDYVGDASPTVPPTIRWTGNGKAVAFVATRKGISNILAQPLAGGEPKKMTDFSADRIFSFDFTPDGKKIVFARGVLQNNLLMITEF